MEWTINIKGALDGHNPALLGILIIIIIIK